MGKTKIEWSDDTWNPVVGCSVVSPGCTNCYAMRGAARLAANPQTPHYKGTVQTSKAGPVWTGKVAMAPDATLLAPLRWRNPRRVFVNSMGDLFEESIPDEWIDLVFAVMKLCPQHTFQVLTKRAERMRAYLTQREVWMRMAVVAITVDDLYLAGVRAAKEGPPTSKDWPLPNVWLGVSAEDQARADERIPVLLQTPAAIRFVSAEPLLGPIDFTKVRHQLEGQSYEIASVLRGDDGFGPNAARNCLDWVIVGGESGPSARPMHPQWARDIREQCERAGVAFFFKQWGAWSAETVAGTEVDLTTLPPDQAIAWGDGKTNHTCYTRVGKKRAGRTLDGKEHNEFPAVSA